jgi:hypothetical protein
MNRRHLRGASARGGASFVGLAATPPVRALSAAAFGAVGDGKADDTAALQAAIDAAFAPDRGGLLTIPPGTYRVTRTLRVRLLGSPAADLTRQSGIQGQGARILSQIADKAPVLELVSRATVRFVLIAGLDILGSGGEGPGIHLECEAKEHYLYNFCLRDVVVQGCGGDGCRMIGNVFEGQLFNCYFRDNRGSGATFGHGRHGGILSAIHVFGCVFGQNGQHGAALINRCYDVSFHGCYFLLNARFGLAAENGCTLLANCGFENNHEGASGFAEGDAGIGLQGFATLISCTAYSIFKQTHLVRAYLTGHFVMVGCSGSGDDRAKGAALAKLSGSAAGRATVIGCTGAVQAARELEVTEIGTAGTGVRVGSHWKSANLMALGDYRLWVDRGGRLRLKKGAPDADDDGALVGG